MTQVVYGPVNITTGNSAKFVAEFLDSNGLITTPSTASIAVSYTNTSNTTQTDTVTMTLVNSFWTGTWSSTSASLGVATWTLTSGTTTAQTGLIRVIDQS